MRHLSRAALALVLAIVAACSGAEESAGLRAMTFMAGFTAQANLPFVGVYVAEDQGYFEDEGLDVAIQHSGGGGEHLQLLAAGEVDVTTQDAAVLLERRADPGLPLVSIGLVGQRGQQAYAALVDSGIESPADWAGMRVGFKGTPAPDVFAILDAAGLEPSDVEMVNVGFDPRVLTEGQVDVYPVFKSNEPDVLADMGFDVNLWEAADYGAPTLGLTYVATEETVADDPEMLHSFMAAVMRGIEYAETNPEDAVDAVMDHAGDQAERDHQRFILDTELADAHSEVTEEHGMGWQTPDQWQALEDFLVRYDALSSGGHVEGAFTNRFLPQQGG